LPVTGLRSATVPTIDVLGNPQWGVLAVDPDGKLYIVGDGFTVAKSSTMQNGGLPPAWDFSTTMSLDGSMGYSGGPNPGGLLGQVWIAAIFIQLVMAMILAVIIRWTGFTGWAGGMSVGFWLWVGFVATFSFGRLLWEGGKVSLWLLNNGYNLLSLLIMGAILGAAVGALVAFFQYHNITVPFQVIVLFAAIRITDEAFVQPFV